ncbi:hypothetical protein NOK12_05760 [Nocardioides sp. OK12]|uniref:hypothetical protein n=1 Tax=Nocardioides sp. OK12 TaxID=2758661 RepID=UPI0021C2C479|nr:hypothetical protein [Nocardioides sp. OK12]GHJ58057.1 hypothetical protein NOK12_05760 [Nocardioides sp. OK12]
MSRLPRLLAVGLLLGGLALPALGVAPAAAAAVRIDPAVLARGPSSALPHLEGRRIIDGDLRIRVRGRHLQLLGETADGYLLRMTRSRTAQVRFVRPDGSTVQVVADLRNDDAVLGGDGSVLTVVHHRFRARASTIRAYDPQTGDQLGVRKVKGFADVLDTDGTGQGRVVFATFPPRRTVLWDLATDSGERVSKRPGYHADLDEDLLAVYTRDPYRGGCSVLRTLSDPGTRLWRSCTERVTAVAPGGASVATIDLLSDGIGPFTTWMRTTAGDRVARYRVDGFFGSIDFEDADALLLRTYTADSSGLVRCELEKCELAWRLQPGSPLL